MAPPCAHRPGVAGIGDRRRAKGLVPCPADSRWRRRWWWEDALSAAHRPAVSGVGTGDAAEVLIPPSSAPSRWRRRSWWRGWCHPTPTAQACVAFGAGDGPEALYLPELCALQVAPPFVVAK